MIELLEFQRRAADSIADRYAEYWDDPAAQTVAAVGSSTA